MIPDLIDNDRHRLAEVLQQLLEQSQNPRLDVVTAFFNLKALEALHPELEKLTALRLLLGKEQDQTFVVGEQLLHELESATARVEITPREIQRWKDYLSRDTVAVRLYEHKFLHGKAYIVHGVPALGSIGIVGSSNFTGAGLTTNRELNAVLKQTSAVQDLQRWFDAHWDDAEDYKQELLSLLSHFTRTYHPYEIYIKVIYETLRDQLDQDLQEKDHRPSPIALTDFQHDGYLAAREILEHYGGVMIADSVGLGKTYLTLRLLDDLAYREREMALIICPAAVKETVWRPRLQEFAIPHELVSMEEISRQHFPVDDYARRFRVIVVDESHHFRNPGTQRWKNLFELITRGDPDKKVILLTATPVNNSVFDLYHQLRIITRDDRRALLIAGIPDLYEYFRRAEENREALYEVLEALAVRRSRHFIRQNYPEAEIDGQKVRFPHRELRTVHYSLTETYGPDLYRNIANAIEELSLAPYQVDMYRKELAKAQHSPPYSSQSPNGEETLMERLQERLGWSREQAHEFLLTVGRQTALAGILRVLYLKRLESSMEALRISLRRLYRFLDTFLEALKKGRLLKSEDFRQWLKMEASDDEGEEKRFDTCLNHLPELQADRYDVESLRAAVERDLERLGSILQDLELEHEHRDAKLDRLKDLLISDDLRGRKVVIFSYFKHTARYLYRKLQEDPVIRHLWPMTIVDSGVNPGERTQRIRRFAPRANGFPDLPPDEEIHLLISTDVLSEGQNLQDADVLINYDLHWNPVRMVQRIGRLDRIGSPHARIDVLNFFPEQELDELLGLLERLFTKLDAINRTVGLDASILGETPNPMNFNILRRLEEEDASTLEELEAENELAVGEYLKQDLLGFLKEVGEERLKRIPPGMGALKQSQRDEGFFAAFRNPLTGQHYWLFYDETRHHIVDRRLDAIRPIRSSPDEPAEPLPEDFDPVPWIQKLRRYLWNRIRQVVMTSPRLPSPQRQIVSWLRALPPSAERNRLLEYFEAYPLPDSDLRDLRRLWRKRSSLKVQEWINHLMDFMEHHPNPVRSASPRPAVPEREEDLVCVAWMRVQKR